MARSERAGRDVLLVGFPENETSRIASTLSEAGHRAHPARGATEVLGILTLTPIDLGLVDLGGGFADVLSAIWATRRGRGRGCPLLGAGLAQSYAGMTDTLRVLGLEGLVPRTASPQELVFRVNRVLYAERRAVQSISPRVPVNLPASFDGIDGPARGSILNISETGLFLSTTEILPTNRSITIRFALKAAAPIVATCRVVWANAGGEGQRYFKGMGLQFVHMRPADRAELRRFLDLALAELDGNDRASDAVVPVADSPAPVAASLSSGPRALRTGVSQVKTLSESESPASGLPWLGAVSSE